MGCRPISDCARPPSRPIILDLTSELPPVDSALGAAKRAEIVARLGEFLGAGRIQHSQNVADAALSLARRHAPELAAQAELAGLVHDSAKKLRDSELIQLAERFDIVITPGERETPQLLHGKVGAALLPERFGIDDPEVLTAVTDHVCGRAEMSQLGQILYVADQMAADRIFEGVSELRAAALVDLRGAVALVARKKIENVLTKALWLEPATVEVWNRFHTTAPQN